MTRSPKTPQQKTRDSLARDGGNVHGENAKATRKNVPKRKAKVHRAERRMAHQALAATVAHEDPELADAVEPRLRRKRLEGFRKSPDAAPGHPIERKRQRPAVLIGRRKKARPAR